MIHCCFYLVGQCGLFLDFGGLPPFLEKSGVVRKTFCGVSGCPIIQSDSFAVEWRANGNFSLPVVLSLSDDVLAQQFSILSEKSYFLLSGKGLRPDLR